jgi:hypothetical protein
MKTIRRLLPILFLLSFVTAMTPSQPTLSQGKKQGQGTTPGPPVTKTKIEVQENSGDFASPWVKSLTITSASTLAFRYSTNEPGATSAIWQVSDKPFSSGKLITQTQVPHVIASGALGTVPASGHVSQFEINFALFAPKTPPTSPQSYWVFIVTKNDRNFPVGLASVPVKIVYHKSTQPVTDLSGIPGDKPKKKVSMQFEGVDICSPCQSLVGPIKSLEAQKNIASKNLKETKSSYWTGEVKDLLKQIAMATQQLDHCVISKCGGKSTLIATFSGKATMTTSNSDAKGPFKENVSASVTFFKYDRKSFHIYLSAIQVGPFDTPAGSNTITVTGEGSGGVNLKTGAMTVTLQLHFHQSNTFASDSDLTITLSTSSGSPLSATGGVTLNGSGKFKDGNLGDDTCTLTIAGTISPHP